jgi:hypothetical protein
MAKKEAATAEEDLKRYWYNRWKEGFSWFEVANTLRTGAYNTRDAFLSAEQRFLQDFWEKAEVVREGDTIQIKHDFPPTPPDPEMDLYRVYMGQAGSAIENLLKGIIICGMWLDDPQSIDGVDDFKKLSFPVKGSATQVMGIKTHDLIDLLSAKNMGLTFGDEEKKILKKLSDFVKWGGRYTSPVKYDAMDEPTFQKTMSPIDEPHEHEVIDKIYRTAAEELVRLSSLQRDKRD